MSVTQQLQASTLQDQFLERYGTIALSNQKRIDFFISLVKELNREGIEALPVKGIDLLLRAYPHSLGLRPMSDIDLLIHEKDIPKVRAYFETRDFKRMPESEALVYYSSDGSIILDIMWNLLCLDDLSFMWQRPVSEPVDGSAVKFPHAEDTLFHFILYVTAHRGKLSPLFVQDLDFFLERQAGKVDWNRWVQQVIRLGFKVPVHHGLTYAVQKGIKRIPEEILAPLHPSSLPEKYLAWFFKRTVTEEGRPLVSYAFNLLSIPTWKKKMMFVKRRFFPSRQAIDIRYGENSRRPYLWFLASRFFYLFFRGISFLVRDFCLLLTRKSYSPEPKPHWRIRLVKKIYWVTETIKFFALAFLRPKDLVEINRLRYERFYQKGPRFPVEQIRLSPFENEILDRFTSRPGMALILGCGEGREAIALAKRGWQVTAVDISLSGVGTAEKIADPQWKIDWRYQDITQPFSLECSFDLILLWGIVYHYIPTSQLRIQLLQNCRKHLKVEGLLMFNFNIVPASPSSLRRAAHWWRRGLARLTGGNHDYGIGDTLETLFCHSFSDTEEVLHETKSAGFFLKGSAQEASQHMFVLKPV